MAESLEHGYLTRREQARSEEFRDWLTYHTQPAPPEPTPEGRKRGYMALVEDLAPVYGVDPTLALAVIQQESNFNPRAISPKGAQGLMQLMPATARRFGVTDPFDPADNVRGGLRYLAYLKTLFPGEPDKQLAAYNAGEGAVQAYGGVPPYPETQRYVQRVSSTLQGAPYVGKEEQAALRGAVGEAMTTMPARGERLETTTGAQQRAVTQAPPTAGVQEGTTVQVAPGRIGPERQAMVPVTEEEAAIFEGSYTPPTAVTVEPGRLEAQRQPLSPVLGPGLEPGLEEPLEARLPVRVVQGALHAIANVLTAVPAFEQFVGIETPFGNTAQDVALSLEEVATSLEPPGKEAGLVDRLAEVAGGQIAFFGAGVTGQQALRFLTAAAPRIVRAVGLTPAAIAAVTEAGAEAAQTYEALRRLVGDQQAAQQANTVFWRNVWLLTVTNKLGIFGGAEKPLARVLAGGTMESVQEVMQYDVQRRGFWVPGDHPKAKELLALGWQRQGDRVQAPFDVATATEAGVLGAVLGGGLAGLAGEIGTPRAPRTVPGLDLLRAAGEVLTDETGAIGRGERERLRATGAGVVGAGSTNLPAFLANMGGQLAGLTTTEKRQVYADAKAYLDTQREAVGEAFPRTARLLDLYEQGAEFKDWYAGAREEITQLVTTLGYPQDTELLTRLIGATSPSVRVAMNLDNALRVYLAHKAGMPVEPRVTAANLMTTHMPNVRRALAGEDLSGPKVQNFVKNILGDTEAVTIDTWMMQIWGYGTKQAPTPNQYRMLRAWVTDLARMQGVTPSQMQAALWVGAKLQTELAGEQQADIPKPLHVLLRERTQRTMQALRRDNAALGTLLDRLDERGQVTLLSTMDIAQTLIASGIGGAIGETDEERILGILAGGTLGMLFRPSILRRALRRVRQNLSPRLSGVPIGSSPLLSERGGISLPQFPQQPSPPRPVSLAEGAAGLEPSRFRDDKGRWRIPLKDMPSEELELQDFIRQQGGIKLTNEELQGELQALISRRETGLSGLQNNVTGRSLQAMAERAEEVGFTATADKTSLLEALDRSVNLGRPVYSVAASGYVHLVEDPLLRQLYEQVVTLSETYAARVETQRRGVQSRLETHARGAEMLATGAWTVEDILEIEPGTVLDPVTTSALIQGLWKIGDLMQQKAQQYVDSGAGVGSPEEKSFLQGVALFAEADPVRLGVMAELGRGLGILNDPLSAYNRFLNQFQPVLSAQGELSSLQLARRIAALNTPMKVAKTVEKMTQPGVADMLLEVWINGMLSGPKTQMVNFLSNMVTAMWAIPERLVAGMYGSLLPGGAVSMGEAQAMLWGAVQGIREGWQLAAHVVRTGERSPQVGVGTTRQEVRYPKALTAQNVGMDPETPWGMAFDFWAEYIGLGSGGRLPTRGLMVTDEFFRAVNYRMELAALAYRKARGTGRSAQEMRDYYAEVVTNPDAADMRQAAQQFALIQTFQQDLPPGSWGAQVQGLAGATLQLPGGTTWPVGRALLPFVKTPVNLARWATERTIPGAFYREMWDDLTAGGERRDLAAAKITLGTMTQLAVAGLVSMGVLTGRGPEDKRLREILLRQGWQPYSLRIGNVYVGYDRFDPLGMMLGMTADLVQLSGDHSLDTTGKALAAPFFVLARNITSKTYMRSLAEFFDAVSPQAYEEPGQAVEGAARWLRSRLASLVPSSVATVTQLVDPADRELWEWFDGALERTPWTVDNLPLKRDRWGDPKLLGWGFDDTWLTRLGRSVTPFTVDVERFSPIDRELEDNAIRLGMPGKTFLPRTAMISEFYGDPTIDPQLTTAQYERYVLYSAANREELRGLGLTYPEDTLRQLTRGAGRRVRETPPAAAMDLRRVLNWLVTTERYLEQSKGPGGGRDEFIREVVVDYQEAARDIMLATDPVLRTRYESAIKIRELQRVPEGQKERWQERYERQQQRQQQRYERRLGIGR